MQIAGRVGLWTLVLAATMVGCPQPVIQGPVVNEIPVDIVLEPLGRSDVPYDPRERIRTPQELMDIGRSCTSNAWLIDYPIDLQVPNSHRQRINELAQRLSDYANTQIDGAAVAARWFLRPCERLGQGAVRARVQRVFSAASGVDADGRHHRLTFTCGGDNRPMPVRKGAQCDVVAAIKGIYAGDEPQRDGAQPVVLPVEVSRECEGLSQQATTDWHVDRVAAPAGGSQPVVLAVVDTPAASTPGHGELVEAVVSDMLAGAPGVDVRRIAALGNGRGANTHEIARALGDLARAVRKTAHPLVVNLSFGWPPEYGQRATLRGQVRTTVWPTSLVQPDRGTCVEIEGPTGEAVRTALLALHERAGPTLVFAAAGNRAPALDRILPPGAVAPAGVTWPNSNQVRACGRDVPPPSNLFLPAGWSAGNLPTCAAGGQSVALTIPIGADNPWATTWSAALMVGAHFGPGAHVPVDLWFPPAVTVSRSGTSLATAVASGLAARLWSAGDTSKMADWTQRHTCREAGLTSRLHLQANGKLGACAGSTPVAFNPASMPKCVGAACAPTPGAHAKVAQAKMKWPDQYALGLATPQPEDGPCPEDGCKVIVSGDHLSFDFSASIDSQIVAAPAFPRLANVKLVLIESGGARHEYALTPTSGWVGGSYSFTGNSLYASLKANPSALQAADYRFECDLIESSTSTVHRSDPVSVYIP